MHRSPRIPSLAGFSSQGALLLALVGAGLAAFLLFVLPRMSASRAAGPSGARPEPAAMDGTPPAETVQLVPAVEVDPEPEPPAPLAVTPPAAEVALAEQEAEPVKAAKVEGPKLKYERTGKAEKIDNQDLRAPQREQRRERRERAAAAAAQGLATEVQPEPQKAKAAPNPDRWRVSNRSGTGRTGIGKGKGKTKGG